MKLKYTFIMICMIISVYLVFNISHKTQNVRENLIKVKSDIIKIENDIHLLKVEWSYLTNPTRIQKLSDKHLNLKLQTQDNIRKQEVQLVFNENN